MKPAASPSLRIVDTDTPLLGRVFEARAEAEMSALLEQRAEDAFAEQSAGQHIEHVASHRTDASDDPILPFLGTVLDHDPGATITIERRLDLEEDLYLPDHSFVFAPGVKPMSACLPVLPMTMSLEAMAEVAACLVPGFGLVGFEAVQAARWIDLVDTDATTLHITARLDRYDAERNVSHIAVAIRIAGQTSPAISANVLFGDRYEVALEPVFSKLTNAHRYALDAEQLYAERHLFHGPSFQSLVGDIIIGDEGLAGELIVLSPEGLFRSTRRPQLLIYPTLLDAIGQLMGVFALEHDRFAFPIGLEKMEIYCPTPPVGTRTPVRAEITRSEGKTLVANVEVQDGSGAVWMRIEGWRSWKFRWERRLVDFRRLPHRYLLARAAPAPGLEASVMATLNADDLGSFDSPMLARYCLSIEEMAAYRSHDNVEQRQQQWLLGRIVAKDAARLWAAEQAREPVRLHPASFSIEQDASGRPFIGALPTYDRPPPHVSIAHCGSRAIALAHSEPVSVDIERIAAREDSFVQTFATPRERELLDERPVAERDAWITRLWCAKEAVGKLLGVGVGAPRALEAIAMEDDGRIQIRYRESLRAFTVDTSQDSGFVIAMTSLSRAIEQDAGPTFRDSRKRHGSARNLPLSSTFQKSSRGSNDTH